MAKKKQNTSQIKVVRLQVATGKANPSPPIGPALGQHGVNIMDFCKRFNAETDPNKCGLKIGTPVGVLIYINPDRTFTISVKRPPVSYLIKESLGIQKGSGVPNKNKVGKISLAAIEKIIEIKKSDLPQAKGPKEMARIIMGTARSMGVDAEE